MPKFTARATILSLLTLCSIAHSQINTLPTTPYLAKNATRYYFLNELDSCPGVLDMQAGDLWTITFPENISNYFLTRPGMIEAKAQGNRLILTPLTSSGTVPLLVITENNLAPKFMITVKAGTGGRLKDVQVLSGTPAKTTCPIGAAPSTATRSVTTIKPIPARPLNTRQTITPALTVTKKTPTALETSPGRAPTVTNPQVSTNSTAHHPIYSPLTMRQVEF